MEAGGWKLEPGTPVHNRTDSDLATCQDRYTADCRNNHMLFIVGVVIVLIAVGLMLRVWVPDSLNSAHLGTMSEQWLAEHHASHSL